MPQIHRIFGWVFQNIVVEFVREFRHKNRIVRDVRHKFWQTLTIPSQFVTESDQSVTKLWRTSQKLPSAVEFLLQKLWRTFRHNFRNTLIVKDKVITIFLPHKIVTDDFLSQFSVTITFVMNEIVTDSFPSQNALFRHNFINFPSHNFRHKLQLFRSVRSNSRISNVTNNL